MNRMSLFYLFTKQIKKWIPIFCRHTGLPWWHSGKESACQCIRFVFNPWVGKIPWSRKWQPTPAFLPGKFYGQRSLASSSPWGQKRVGHDLETKQQQTWGVEKGCFPPSPLNTNPKRIMNTQAELLISLMNTQQAELLISSKRDVHPSIHSELLCSLRVGHMPGPGGPKIMVQFLHLRTCCCCCC